MFERISLCCSAAMPGCAQCGATPSEEQAARRGAAIGVARQINTAETKVSSTSRKYMPLQRRRAKPRSPTQVNRRGPSSDARGKQRPRLTRYQAHQHDLAESRAAELLKLWSERLGPMPRSVRQGPTTRRTALGLSRSTSRLTVGYIKLGHSAASVDEI